MNKTKICMMVIAGIILISAVSFAVSFFRKPGQYVEIVQDGVQLYHLDLQKEKDQQIVIPWGDDWNTISIQGGQISVTEASCPDQICVNMGVLQYEALPIVCLPHRLIIQFCED